MFTTTGSSTRITSISVLLHRDHADDVADVVFVLGLNVDPSLFSWGFDGLGSVLVLC